ncbi:MULTISPECIES: hypothetical protein [unclassified Sphingomonas]|uniref:hypothetical protein n=1 Tax=unclassified Sphingomonas TaxID=196159 RepID=UPI001F59FE35|nr:MULTISPECIES: hypothetical protein [unclassified Sphingomonas]
MVRALMFVAALTLPMMAAAQAPATTAKPAAQSGDTITAADVMAREDHAGVAEQAETGQPVKRIRNIALTGTTPCPKASTPDEVVVCSRVDEPFRIPKPLRDKKPIPAQNQSWVNRTAMMDQVGREAGGLPDTCSPVGTGGQTGCTTQMLQNWTAERVAKRNGQSIDPTAP